MNRGQAAMEFLTTYGWMFMIVGLAGGALAYFGVFDLDNFAPETCVFNQNFACERNIIKTNGDIRLEVKNYLGESVKLTGIDVKLPDGTEFSTAHNQDWTKGETIPITAISTYNFIEGERYSVEITIHYLPQKGFEETVTGKVQGKAVS